MGTDKNIKLHIVTDIKLINQQSCNTCFEDIKNHAAQRCIPLLCPHDREDINIIKVVDDKGISRAILDLKVNCNHAEDGCPWIGELRNLQTHLDNRCSSTLLKKLIKRVETCERKLVEKDEEIRILKHHVLNAEGEVKT